MTRYRVAVAASLLLAGATDARVSSQQPAPASSDRQSYTSATTAILVDVVVRDRKGKPLTDLTAADFQVFEDGLVQKVDSFTRVSRGGLGRPRAFGSISAGASIFLGPPPVGR